MLPEKPYVFNLYFGLKNKALKLHRCGGRVTTLQRRNSVKSNPVELDNISADSFPAGEASKESE